MLYNFPIETRIIKSTVSEVELKWSWKSYSRSFPECLSDWLNFSDCFHILAYTTYLLTIFSYSSTGNTFGPPCIHKLTANFHAWFEQHVIGSLIAMNFIQSTPLVSSLPITKFAYYELFCWHYIYTLCVYCWFACVNTVDFKRCPLALQSFVCKARR